MNAVGIDVSKGKSTVTIRRPGGKVVLAPRDYKHNRSAIDALISEIKGLEGETKVCITSSGSRRSTSVTLLKSSSLNSFAVMSL